MRAWVLLSAVLWYLTGGGALPARPPASPLFPVLPHAEPWLLFYVKSQWFLFSAVGWQRSSERNEKGFIYGKPGHPGNKDLVTCRVDPKSQVCLALLRCFPRWETERTFMEHLLCAPHFPKVSSFHP